VRIFNLCARASGSETPACAKPLGRCPQAGRQCDKNRQNLRMNKISKMSRLTLLIVTAFFFASCKAGENQITMSVQGAGEVTVVLAGSGTATIDWGDGTEKKAVTPTKFSFGVFHKHQYSDLSNYTITVVGDSITYFSCSGDPITSLNVSKYSDLLDLSFHSTRITNIDVSKNLLLRRLSCVVNQLGSLDVSKNTKLEELFCAGNNLTSIDVSKNTALQQLNVSENQLTSLDISKNTVLFSLTCASNRLTDLNVVNNTELQELYCDNNLLTNLDIGKNVKLRTLGFTNNQIANIDVSKNIELSSLFCFNNLLVNLELSSNKKMTFLRCQSNKLSAEALNSLFETLHGSDINHWLQGKTIFIYGNPGANESNTNIAIEKGWIVDKITETQ
jgi:hypothetical protein